MLKLCYDNIMTGILFALAIKFNVMVPTAIVTWLYYTHCIYQDVHVNSRGSVQYVQHNSVLFVDFFFKCSIIFLHH